MSEKRNLFVAGLSAEVTDQQLHQAFQMFGQIESAKIMKDIHRGNPRGFGFVLFSHPDDAASAVECHNTQWKVQYANHDGFNVIRRSRKVYARNIPLGMTDPQLHELFSQYGTIKALTSKEDSERTPRSFGPRFRQKQQQQKPEGADDQPLPPPPSAMCRVCFVEFSSDEEAAACIKATVQTTLSEFMGPMLTKYAETPEVRDKRRNRMKQHQGETMNVTSCAPLSAPGTSQLLGGATIQPPPGGSQSRTGVTPSYPRQQHNQHQGHFHQQQQATNYQWNPRQMTPSHLQNSSVGGMGTHHGGGGGGEHYGVQYNVAGAQGANYRQPQQYGYPAPRVGTGRYSMQQHQQSGLSTGTLPDLYNESAGGWAHPNHQSASAAPALGRELRYSRGSPQHQDPYQQQPHSSNRPPFGQQPNSRSSTGTLPPTQQYHPPPVASYPQPQYSSQPSGSNPPQNPYAHNVQHS